MIWDIISDKIETAGLATVGENLFEQRMPNDPAVCVGMFEPLDGVKIDPHLPGYYKPNLKIIVRHNEVGAGKKLATDIMNLLWLSAEEIHEATPERGRVDLKIFYPKSLPIQFPSLIGNLTEWSLNFTTAFTINQS
jgi:hypothetical protein